MSVQLANKPNAEAIYRVRALGSSLRNRFERQAQLRSEIEDRWLRDLAQYHGRYDKATQSRLDRDVSGLSKIFVNLTRPRCRSMIARIMEMMFPVEDRNYELSNTPIPEMLNGLMDQEMAKAAAKAMQNLIDDQLVECDYESSARDAIKWMTILGTGILKGPIVDTRIENAWQSLDGSTYALEQRTTKKPIAMAVNPFDWFPDMSAVKLEDCEFFFERRYVGRKMLRALAKNPIYDTDAIRRALREQPRGTGYRDPRRQELRAVAGGAGQNQFDENLYELIEYRGPIEPEDAYALGIDYDSSDPLVGVDVIVEMVGDTIIRSYLQPLETQEIVYSVVNLVEDEGSVFGYGLPHVIASPQSAVNMSWRLMLDDANYSVGKQIVVRREIVKPADGDYTFAPRKVWFLDDPMADIRQSFYEFNIEGHQPFIMSIFQAAKQLIDEESQLPSLMQGEMGATPIQTASGMSLLTNNATLVLRDVLKNWDSKVTEPLIKRFYDYNMQYSDDPAVKGDFKIQARCSSVLMAKETQVPSLVQLGTLSQQPNFSPYAKFPEILRALVEAMRLSPDKMVKTDEEISAEQQNPRLRPNKVDAQQKSASDAEKNQLNYQIHAERIASQERMKAAEMQDRSDQRQFEMIKSSMDAERAAQEMRLKQAIGSGI